MSEWFEQEDHTPSHIDDDTSYAKIDSLYEAAFYGNKEEVLKRLSSGENPDQLELDVNSTPLIAAILEGHTEIVDILLESGAKSNLIGFEGQLSTHVAAWCGHLDILKKLDSLGVSLDTKDDDGYTPLHLAAQNGHDDTVRFLAGRNVDLCAITHEGFTPAALAQQYYHEHTAKLINEIVAVRLHPEDNYIDSKPNRPRP